MLKKLCKDRRGYVMAYSTMLITLVMLPMMLVSIEIVRMMFVDVHLQSAVDAACAAASQAVDVPHFIATGELVIDPVVAVQYANREFDNTVANAGINQYLPVLTGVSITNGTTVYCQSIAGMNWMLPGLSSVVLSANSAAEARETLGS